MSRPRFVPEMPDDTERFARMSPEDRLSLFFELCDLTDRIVNERPDAEVLRRGTPRSAESEAVWRRLMERGPLRRSHG
jgi:hypothetical protein